jgi:AmpD protein
MKLDISTGLLSPVKYLPSPHCDARPANIPIDLIVVHNISLPPGQFGTGAIEQFFCGKLDYSQHPYFATIAELKVSAHLLIKRDGEVVQFVPFAQRAWHAGVSNFQGRERCNDFSIGIELEGTDDLPYEKEQYNQLARVIRLLQDAYPDIRHDRITGHAAIAPARKTDPGPAFDWMFLDCLLNS